MPNLRLFLFMSLGFVGFLLWQEWQKDYGPQPSVATPEAALEQIQNPNPNPDLSDDAPSTADIPTAPVTTTAPQNNAVPDLTPVSSAPKIRVETDVLELEIDTAGGSVVEAKLSQYPVSVEDPSQHVRLFGSEPGYFYVAQSGLISNGADAPNHRALFTSSSDQYVLGPGDDTLIIPLVWTSETGVRVEKRYELRRGSYEISMTQTISNGSGQAWTGSEYRQLQRNNPNAGKDYSFTDTERYSFAGSAVYSPEEKYQKYDYEDMHSDPINQQIAGGWASMVQHYFISAWVPPAEQSNTYITTAINPTSADPRYLVRMISSPVTVAAGSSSEFSSTLFVGPKLQDQLDTVAPGLALTVDYGILTPFSKILFWLLDKIYSVVQNWGVAIILLTVLVKAAFFKLSEAQYRSMARMRKLQPRIVSLKERYGDDKARMNQAMMELYKKEKVNPLGGCLPMLVQIPVFIALYWVLLESVELRQAPFMLWLNDLSAPDPYFVLPIINGAAMFATTKLSPTPGMDPMQQKIMTAMPLIFAVMFAFFQAGLVLYWTVNSVLSLAQQWFIIKRVAATEK